MSVRENIASNLLSVISAISSPDIKKATRQPFLLDELSEQQYPAVIIQTSEENRDDSELGSGAKTRHGTIDFVALDTEVVQVETDEGSLFPIGGIRMTIRCMYEFQAGTP